MMNRIRNVSKWLMFALLVLFSLWSTVTATQLYRHSRQPVDAILVLGGSIRREMYVADQRVADQGVADQGVADQKTNAPVDEGPGQSQSQGTQCSSAKVPHQFSASENHPPQSPYGLQPRSANAKGGSSGPPPCKGVVRGGSSTAGIFMRGCTQGSPPIPILVSKGSKPPCIRILFERVAASMEQVWLENCARSTFDNYRYGLPILQSWQAHHVQVVTSPSHLPRAQWLAQIILGSHGIWVEMNLVEEKGIPGNTETRIKTGLDVTRSLLWAILSQIYSPSCRGVIPLESVDLAQWEQRGFKCEHQANIN